MTEVETTETEVIVDPNAEPKPPAKPICPCNAELLKALARIEGKIDLILPS